MIVLTWISIGFFSAIGWWGANYYVIDPYFPESQKVEKKSEEHIKKITE